MHQESPIHSPVQLPDQHNHVLAAPMLRFDLRSEWEQLQRQAAYHKGSPAGKTLVKEPDLRIVLIALCLGARMEEHRTSGPLSIQVLEGHLRLRFGKEDAIELRAGELVMLERGIPHDVEALDEAVFLLTIGRTTYQHVSDQHEPKM